MKLLLPLFFAAAALIASAGLAASATPGDFFVGVNKSSILENPGVIKRISVANPEVAEAVAVSTSEVLVNGKAAGDTTLIVWDTAGQRSMFDVHVTPGDSRPDAVRGELERELAGQDVHFDLNNGTVFLRGTVDDLPSADRAAAITATLGKVVNLLHVKVPEADPQILLKVRFAEVDRTAAQQLALNIISTGATNTIGAVSTGQFGQQPTFDFTKQPGTVTFNDLLNVFLLRPDLNLAAAIEALEQKQVVQILAEPNLLTVSNRPASFLAGGEFPYPTLQGGAAGVGQITIQFREFGVRIHFEPVITPRGTIRLAVTPEVSALDYANGLTISGYTIPGLTTRRVQTEVELQNGQSFVIAGLLDNRMTENLSKIPGIGDIPLLGKLFQSRLQQKTNTELLVLVTPVLVRPLAPGVAAPEVKMPNPFMKSSAPHAPQAAPDPDAKLPAVKSVPVEVIRPEAAGPAAGPSNNNNNGVPPGVKPLLELTPPPTDINNPPPATAKP